MVIPNETLRAKVLNEVLGRLGPTRALEANDTHITPAPSQLGVWDDDYPVVGVDIHHGKYRARIRYCDALSGQDVRITLIRSEELEDAVWAYRYGHVALWGSASWAACDDIMDHIRQAR